MVVKYICFFKRLNISNESKEITFLKKKKLKKDERGSIASGNLPYSKFLHTVITFAKNYIVKQNPLL